METKELKTINLAPLLILVDGYFAARTFLDFVKYCDKNGLKESDFKNWPFMKHLDGTLTSYQ